MRTTPAWGTVVHQPVPQMRQMTREDFRGPTPTLIGPEQLAAIERQHYENMRRQQKEGNLSSRASAGGRTAIAGMCCYAGFEIAQMCVVAVFMLNHEDFCNEYWEQRDADGVYTIGGDKYWPTLNGQAKTYLWSWVYLLTLGVNCIVNLAALTSHLICSRSLDNTCHAFMQYLVTFCHIITSAFGLAWGIIGTIWTFGDKVIPWECKDGDLGNNNFYIFMAVFSILSLVAWPFFCLFLMIKSRGWWHDPSEGDKLMATHWNNEPRVLKPDPSEQFRQFGYLA